MGMFWGAVLEPKILQISKCKKIDYTETNRGISTSQVIGCTADKNYLLCPATHWPCLSVFRRVLS